MLRKTLLPLLLTVCLIPCISAGTFDEDKHPLTSASILGGLSSLQMRDAYLSSLPYQGFGLQFDYTGRRPLKPYEGSLSFRTDYKLDFGALMNAPGSAAMLYFGNELRYSWQWCVPVSHRLDILLGPSIGSGIGCRNLSYDTNNSVSLDLFVDLALSMTMRSHFRLFGQNLRALADFSLPMAGCKFSPGLGESYYEMFELGNFDRAFSLTSPINNQALDTRLQLLVPLKRSVLSIGLNSCHVRSKINGLFQSRDIVAFQMGAAFELALFGGRKNPAPPSFISPESTSSRP